MKHLSHLTLCSALVAAGLLASASFAQTAKAPPQGKEAQAAQLYDDALTRVQKQDYPGALIQLKNALKLDNKNLSVQVLLGRALLGNGEVAAAEVAFNEALRLGVNRSEVVLPLARSLIDQGKQQALLNDPRLATDGLSGATLQQLLLLRAGALADTGDSKAALKTIDDARALDARSADSWVAEVPIRLRARQFPEALAAADRALALTPASPQALYMRGQVAHLSGDSKTAMSWYDKTLKENPKHVEALVSRAGLLLDVGKVAEAERDVSLLVTTSKTEPRGWYLKALIAERQRRNDDARKALNDVTALLDPIPIEYLKYRPQVLMLGGLAHHGLRQFEKARPYLEAVQRLQPAGPVNKLLAEIYLQDKNLDRAIEMLDGYLRAYPNDSQATALLASVHMAQGRYARAVQVSQDALKRNDHPALRSLLGMGLLGTGRIGGAVAELEDAVRKDPGQIQAGATLAGLYLQSGQPAKALKHAQALLQRHPKSAQVHHLVGSAKAAMGDAAGATASFEQSLKLDPKLSAPAIALAKLTAAKGNAEAATTQLLQILAKEPKNAEAMSELSLLLERHGKLADAQSYLEKADDLSGPDAYMSGLRLVEFHLRQGQAAAAKVALGRISSKAPEALAVLLITARVQLANGDAASAKSTLNRASSLASYDATMLTRIAVLQMDAGNVPGAMHAVTKALDERPDYLSAQALAADLEIRQREFDKAERRIRQIQAKHPRLAVGHALMGDMAMARSQPAAALDAYRKAQQIEPSTEGLLRVFRIQTRQDAAAANALAQAWLTKHPNDASVRLALADGHARAGQFPAARAQYEAVLKLAPDSVEALNNLAHVLIFLKDPGALAVADRALALRPTTPHILGTAGWAAFKADKPDLAVQRLRDARLRDPNNPDIRYLLAAVLAATAKPGEAREELQAALRDGKPFQYAKEAAELQRTLR